jgi:hypothetical protein
MWTKISFFHRHGSSGPVKTFFVVASTDMAQVGILMDRIRDQVGALPQLRTSGTLRVTAEMVPMPPAGDPRTLEQQILDVADRHRNHPIEQDLWTRRKFAEREPGNAH